jgi:hypothetical protein
VVGECQWPGRTLEVTVGHVTPVPGLGAGLALGPRGPYASESRARATGTWKILKLWHRNRRSSINFKLNQ